MGAASSYGFSSNRDNHNRGSRVVADHETDGLSVTEPAKQAGAVAFGKTVGKGTFDSLADDALFPEMAKLWDCETVEELKGVVAASDQPAGAVNALLAQARAEFLAAVLVALGVHQTNRKRGR